MHRISFLPIYLPHFSLDIRDWHAPAQPQRDAEKWILAISVFLLLFFLILWWYSLPVHVEIKDGRIVAIRQIEFMPLSLNDSLVELVFLASTTSPIASSPQNFTRNNETEAHLVRKTD